MASRDLRRTPHPAVPSGSDRMAEPSAPEGVVTPSRRRFLRRAGAGGAVAFGATSVTLSALASAAFAQTTGTTAPGATGTTPAGGPGTAPSTTAPAAAGSPATVQGAELALLQFAQTIELGLDALYGTALESGRLRSQAADLARSFQLHHRDHATRMVDFAESQAPNRANSALVGVFSGRVSGASDEQALIGVLRDLESGIAATYLWALGQLNDWQAAAAVATILPVESQHAAAWSRLLEPDLAAWVGRFSQDVPTVLSQSGRLDPAQYPTNR